MFHTRIILMALRGLRQNLLRSMLATLGVIIGVGAVVSAMSILSGAHACIVAPSHRPFALWRTQASTGCL